MICLPATEHKAQDNWRFTMNNEKKYPAFSPDEFEVRRTHKVGMYGMFDNMGIASMPREEPIFNRPISEKENFARLFAGQTPCWVPMGGFAYCDVNPFEPRIFPDNVAAHVVSDGEDDYDYKGETVHRSWFDLDWVYVPVAGGSTVQPGHPLIEDMNDWEKILTWPDLDALNWDELGSKNKEFLDTPQLNELHLACGLWERLISLMDVSGAAIALIDEDQQDAVKSFFDRYADFMIDMITRVKKVCDIDCVLIHDDWGHHNGAFFSLDTAMEMIVPYQKRIVDAVHDMGMYYEAHCCGKAQDLVPAMTECGINFWCMQSLNDADMLAEKYKDSDIYFGLQEISLAPDAPEEEAIAFAQEWFEKYKYTHIVLGLAAANPTFCSEVYRLSRMEYSK